MPAYTYVYILANTFKHIYIGVTSELEHRIWQHKNHAFPGSHTDRYNIRSRMTAKNAQPRKRKARQQPGLSLLTTNH